ncbi:FAD/NAD(P)-binding oxidoreductase [Longimycelium tulufanense]|uniref:FAD/NAD(P)-binding oxidoreductase n=1 Tax=Longimycelium tulufanense TaxID=907463 RepID=A0A8J3C9E6_9PSEU|nr:FAD-dependent oxidoreductase [Longimycelium tulufanense]GGM33418.1 FAD/NAD(P)-binding oxidoreductase [Longimycelium tulufanense]
MNYGTLIVGNGPAAHRLAGQLRHHGHQGAITVLGAEPRPAYNRALLTSVLACTLSADDLVLPRLPENVQVRLGITATRIDRVRRAVYTDDGTVYRYDQLVLATGARPNAPAITGLTSSDGGFSEGVRAIRTVSDCEDIPDGRTIVLGGGVLGVETALALRHRGQDVVLVHPGPYAMDDLLDESSGRLLLVHLENVGVKVFPGARAAEYAPGKLALDDGHVLDADTLLLCTGIRPNIELARAAGLAVRTGVLIDDHLRTSDPHIYAIGDCSEHRGAKPGHIAPAWEQAEQLARLLTGHNARYVGTRLVVRLRTSSIDVASFGSPGENTDRLATESVTLSDPARGRYARLILRDQRIVHAVLVGLPRAIASISQLVSRSLPVPSSRLALLLGTSADHWSNAELPDDAVICVCNNVTKKALTCAWRDGARELTNLVRTTRATTGCGSCQRAVERIYRSLSSTTETSGAT